MVRHSLELGKWIWYGATVFAGGLFLSVGQQQKGHCGPECQGPISPSLVQSTCFTAILSQTTVSTVCLWPLTFFLLENKVSFNFLQNTSLLLGIWHISVYICSRIKCFSTSSMYFFLNQVLLFITAFGAWMLVWHWLHWLLNIALAAVLDWASKGS